MAGRQWSLAMLAALMTACGVGSYSGHVTSGPSSSSPPGAGGPPATPTDLPCDVADVLTSSCMSCHGSPPAGGAPMSLTSLAQLLAPSPGNAAVTTGQACVQRMASTTSPMPPLPAAPVDPAKQTAFAAWVSSGMPAGSCGADAGTPDPVFSGAPTCTSGAYWTVADGTSPTMRPGEACIACHSQGEGPAFAIAGTAYPTGHEYDDCDGRAAQAAIVTVTDRTHVSRSFTVNSAGNFYGAASGGWPVFPITAKISLGGKTRAMSGAVSTGDCNTCHTLSGASGAPGRIALP
jgi:hypothetical protein